MEGARTLPITVLPVEDVEDWTARLLVRTRESVSHCLSADTDFSDIFLCTEGQDHSKTFSL